MTSQRYYNFVPWTNTIKELVTVRFEPLPKIPPHLSFQIISDDAEKLTHPFFKNISLFSLANLFLVNELPPSITHLSFGHEFNQKVNHLPESLSHLYFQGVFFPSYSILLPSSPLLSNFKYLCTLVIHSIKKTSHFLFLPPLLSFPLPPFFLSTIPHSPLFNILFQLFNQSIDSLPSGLNSLTLNYHFNHPVEVLPPSLTHLILGIYPHLLPFSSSLTVWLFFCFSFFFFLLSFSPILLSISNTS